ncbi:MAG: PrsW family glutamic-type intramembrane protease [Chroococcales cyanobacterium]
MTETRGFLRQLSTGGVATELLPPYELLGKEDIIIGRDPNANIPLNPYRYKVVSRRHLVLRPQGKTWEVCDLDSANGTYLNDQRLYGCEMLKPGDRIKLGLNGPEFSFELQSIPSNPISPIPAPDEVTLSQLFPIVSTGRDLQKKAYLVPAVLTVVFVVAMFTAVGNALAFNLLLASYLAGSAYFYVYRLCGKNKPWWLLFLSGLTTAVILATPLLDIFIVVFRDVLPGDLSNLENIDSFLELFIRMFFGAGLMEELIKAVPIFAVYWIGRKLRSPWKEKIGVNEPLDAILLGTASAVGFTLLETLGQYVPDIINNVTLQGGEGSGELLGLQLLIPRILGSVAGHMAYSGYLGYFIGLSVLKPSQRWRILGIGYLSASFLHALWNATGFYSGVLLAVVGVISYAFLAAAILKARALSPTRSQNFATRLSNHP